MHAVFRAYAGPLVFLGNTGNIYISRQWRFGGVPAVLLPLAYRELILPSIGLHDVPKRCAVSCERKVCTTCGAHTIGP